MLKLSNSCWNKELINQFVTSKRRFQLTCAKPAGLMPIGLPDRFLHRRIGIVVCDVNASHGTVVCVLYWVLASWFLPGTYHSL